MSLSPFFSALGLLASLSEGEVSPDALRVTLIDVPQNLRIEDWSTSSEGLAPDSRLRSSPPWRLQRDVLHGGRQEGGGRARGDSDVHSVRIIPPRGLHRWGAPCGDL